MADIPDVSGGPPDDEALVIELDHPTRTLDVDVLDRLLRHVIREEGGTLAYLGVVLTDHETVLELNRTYLEHDYHTDVLAFPLGDEDGVVDGEVYVDLDTAAERHAEFDAPFEHEARRYAVHGLLHLLGHDDATPGGKAAMRVLEDRYLPAAE